MITRQQAIEFAREKVADLEYIDTQNVSYAKLITSEYARKMGATAEIRDNWSVSLDRIKTGRPLDGLFDNLLVTVDAETGVATIIENL